MRVVIVEDSGLLRQLLTELLVWRGFDVVGTASTQEEALAVVAAAPPDVVLLDVRLPPDYRDEGLQAARQIRARHPQVGLLVLSHYLETSYAMRLLADARDAVGYLVKDRVQDGDGLVEAINRVAAGEVVIDPDVVRQVMRLRRKVDPLRGLTDAERRVLSLMAEGCSNVAIADRLSCSPKTVEKRTTSISQKLSLPTFDSASRAGVNLRVLAVLTYLRHAGDT